MTKLSGNKTRQGRRLRSRQGVVICDSLPGRFPDAVEYRPAYRCLSRKKQSTLGYVPGGQHANWLIA